MASASNSVGEQNPSANAGNPVTFIDAKDSGLTYSQVNLAVRRIARKELKEDEGMVSPGRYIEEDYFKGIPIAPGLSSPELIILAKVADEVVGFIITAKRKEKGFRAVPADTGYVAYLAVDSTAKRSGVGTQLMLAAMRKTKELGKRYLTLEYVAEGQGIDKERGRAKIRFYNSFTTRFGIPMEERDPIEVARQLHIHPYYDLKNVDFAAIKQVI